MAQTRRKRRTTKHRGNAAGTIETRGRTGRRPTPQERKKQSRVNAREARLDKPPSWKSSITRAAVATIAVFVTLLLIEGKKAKNPVVAAAAPALLAFVIYVPAGYYMDTVLYRRRQRKREEAGR